MYPDGAVDEALAFNRANTEAYIATDPVVIALTPRLITRTPSGGFETIDGEPRVGQVFKLVMQSPSGASIEQRTEDGTERRTDFVLIGTFDAIVAPGDYWDEGSQRYEVTSIIPGNGYEVRANVESYGFGGEHG